VLDVASDAVRVVSGVAAVCCCLLSRSSGQQGEVASTRKGHVRKSSSLQFFIELTETDTGSFSRLRSWQLPPSTAIAALTEPTDNIESSIAMQVGEC